MNEGFAGWMHSPGTQWADVFSAAVQARLENHMLKQAQMVVQLAERLAPRRTGRLAASIGYDWNSDNLQVVFTVEAPYGIFVEYGTRNTHPHPYLRPAINAVFGGQYGFQTEMTFTNTPHINRPLYARGAGFDVPRGLTAKQKAHVKSSLLPTSKAHFKSAVSRSPMHARRQIF